MTNLFLTLAVVTALAISSLGWVSGSAPEWIALKASIGLLVVGLMGWLSSAVMSANPYENVAEDKGRNFDYVLPETVPPDSEVDDANEMSSSER